MRGFWVLVCLIGCGGGDEMGGPTADARFAIDAPPGQRIDARPPRVDAPQQTPGCPANCGDTADDDCCAIAPVTGGTYNRAGDINAPAVVADFGLDKYEVT